MGLFKASFTVVARFLNFKSELEEIIGALNKGFDNKDCWDCHMTWNNNKSELRDRQLTKLLKSYGLFDNIVAVLSFDVVNNALTLKGGYCICNNDMLRVALFGMLDITYDFTKTNAYYIAASPISRLSRWTSLLKYAKESHNEEFLLAVIDLIKISEYDFSLQGLEALGAIANHPYWWNRVAEELENRMRWSNEERKNEILEKTGPDTLLGMLMDGNRNRKFETIKKHLDSMRGSDNRLADLTIQLLPIEGLPLKQLIDLGRILNRRSLWQRITQVIDWDHLSKEEQEMINREAYDGSVWSQILGL